MDRSTRDVRLTGAALVAVVFGLLSIASGGRVLFGDDAARQAAGATMSFVLWFNFAAGFVCVVAGHSTPFASVACRLNRLGLQRTPVFRLHQRRCH
jgi:hypothetical protein